MASAKKKEDLEAGKRKLEEFRKNRAKRSGNRPRNANADEHNRQSVDYQHEIRTETNEAVTSDEASEAVLEPSQVIVNDENGATGFVPNSIVVSSDAHPNPTYHSTYSTEITQKPIENKESDRYDGSWSSRTGSTKYSSSPYEKNDDYSVSPGVSGRHDYGFPSNQSFDFTSQVTEEDFRNSNQHSHGKSNEAYSKETDPEAKEFQFASPATTNNVVVNVSREDSGVVQLENNSSYGRLLDTGLTLSSNEDSVHSSTKTSVSFPQVWRNSHDVVEPSNSKVSSVGERKFNDYFGNLPGGNNTLFWPTESQSTVSTTGPSSSSYSPSSQAVAETRSTRSRSSFLDSLNLPRVEPGKGESFSSKVHDIDGLSSYTFTESLAEKEFFQPFSKADGSYGASAFDHSPISSVPTGNGNDMYRGATNNSGMDRESLFNSRKHDEDFAALEQHIEDLTQEKFSLKRALEASKTLAESLAAENSSLTDSYNQQGSIVTQLKSDMEMLEEEIKAHLVELESVKMEYGNAQLECTAADERAKLLASEVINLEEKTLRLRSSELKLQRQLENSQDEFSSFRRKLLSLEKDRQDLQSTVDALREEKKLLQAKLRRTSASGKSLDVGKSLDMKKDVSTSTEDLLHEDEIDDAADSSNLETDDDAHVSGAFSFPSSLPENGQFNLKFASSRIPSDQLRTIQNINTLISELALEKEELMQALMVESLESSKLKELNKELSRKLEVQTQRLELLTAQSMRNENVSIRQSDPSSMMMENTTYADEGDEVVERVLGWIMKLFPGGPSRRRPIMVT